MKRYFLVGLVMLTLLLSGCNGKAGNSTETAQPEKSEEYCPTIYVPPTVVPEKYVGNSDSFEYYLPDEMLDKEIIWDGWAWDSSPFGYGINDLYCRYGKDEGENAAYLYCDSTLFGVEKSFTDADGNVAEHKKYYMRMIYKPKGNGFSLTEI